MKAQKLVLQCLLVCCIIGMLFTMPAAAQLNGTIKTSDQTGLINHGGHFASKDLVYLIVASDMGNQLPDGNYYFQVTDPSGSNLLSQDVVGCRIMIVAGGIVTGTTSDGSCTTGAHPTGPGDGSGVAPVQLNEPVHFADSRNGVYKAWVTPVANLDPVNCSHNGFCDSTSKTTVFHVRNANQAFITVCKFNDLNGNHVQDSGEELLPGWLITATGVDTGSGNQLGTVTAQTDDMGCVSFSVSKFTGNNPGQVTLSETLQAGWTQTAPVDGACTLVDLSGGIVNANDSCTASGGIYTIVVSAGDDVGGTDFGNNCSNDTCASPPPMVVTKDAFPSFTRTFTWGISKSVDQNHINTSGPATFNYTVSVTHDSGTDSVWQIMGTISISNPTSATISGVTVSDAVDNNGTCQVGSPLANSVTIDIPAGGAQVSYVCTYSSPPSPSAGTNTATAIVPGNGTLTGTQMFDFAMTTPNLVDNSVTVTDTLGGSLGTVSSTDPSPTTFTYPLTFTDPGGTCTTHNNTATFTTNTNHTTGTASQSVQVCVGADLSVMKTATATFSSGITKSVDKTIVQQAGGSITFNYTVSVTESGWMVAGNITVTNPNDWEPVTVNLADVLSDSTGACSIAGGLVQTVPANNPAGSGMISPVYSCTWPTNTHPGAISGTNTAMISWNSATAFTPHSSAMSPPIGYTFSTLTITDTFNSGSPCTLGTVDVILTGTVPNTNPATDCGLTITSPSWGIFKYARTVPNSNPGTCTAYNNTASITGGGSAGQSVTVCNVKTGALTMGFWKGPNGQNIIKNYCGGAAGTSLKTFLNSFNPFKDDTGTTCNNQASYVSTVIGAATCSGPGNTCNLMLKAQMLATSLDVYFSDPALGGLKIGAYNGLGNSTPRLGDVAFDLSHVCSMSDTSSGGSCTGTYEDARNEFGIGTAPNNPGSCRGTYVYYDLMAPPAYGTGMLSYSNFASTYNGNPVSNSGGTNWYQQMKNPKQVYAKDSFDNINNQIANIVPNATGICTPSF